MAPKLSKSQKLTELKQFMQEPSKLAELRKRVGGTLREKLRAHNPAERRWYDFLSRNVFEPDEHAIIDQLHAMTEAGENMYYFPNNAHT